MDFKEHYPLLWQFFGGYFGAYEEEFTDEELASSYRDDVGESELLHHTRAELEDLLHQQDHWQQAADEANRYFATSEQLHHWLLMIQQRLQVASQHIRLGIPLVNLLICHILRGWFGKCDKLDCEVCYLN